MTQRSRKVPVNSTVLSCKSEPQIENTQAKVAQSCSNYSENPEYMIIPMQQVVTASYPAIAPIPTAAEVGPRTYSQDVLSL